MYTATKLEGNHPRETLPAAAARSQLVGCLHQLLMPSQET